MAIQLAKIPIFGALGARDASYWNNNSIVESENVYVDKVGEDLIIKTRPSVTYNQVLTSDSRGLRMMSFPEDAGCIHILHYNRTGNDYRILRRTSGTGGSSVGTIASTRMSIRATPAVRHVTGGTQYIIWGGSGGYIHYSSGANLTQLSVAVFSGSTQVKLQELDGYVLGLDENKSNKIFFSAVGDLTSWSSLDFISTGSIIYNFHVLGDYIYVFESGRTLRYYNDGSTPFVKAKGQDVNVGTIGINSVASDGTSLYLIDFSGRFGVINGVDFNDLGYLVQDKINEILSSSWGNSALNFIEYSGKKYIVIYSTSTYNHNSLVYDIDLGRFYEWYCDRSGDLVGGIIDIAFSSTYNDYMGIISSPATNDRCFLYDITDNGQDYISNSTGQPTNYPIVQNITTGFIDHGTHRQKRSRCIRLRCRKTTSSGTLRIAYRDNAEGSFVTMRDFDIDSDNNNLITIENFANGIYRQRQYKITSEGAIGKLGITDFEEEFEVLGS